MKILVLTSVYPQPDDVEVVTPVVKYFVNDWQKAGHEIIVIHNYNVFHKVFYYIPKFLKEFLHNKFSVLIPQRPPKEILYQDNNNVLVGRFTIFKLFPFLNFSKKTIKKQFNKIVNVLNENSFTPDIILGHWESPQIPLISMLKSKWNSKVKTAIVCHGVNYIQNEEWIKEYLPNIDVFGGRSLRDSKSIKNVLNLSYDPFVCYSGIPDEFLLKTIRDKQLMKGKMRLIYIGQLFARKNVDTIIKALSNIDFDFELLVIGDGVINSDLQLLTNSLCLENKVLFLGRKKRDEIIQYLADSDVFVMPSKDEIFGLVYLEAMSQGCITIGSLNEGIDGIIEDGINGFLVEAGNIKNLEASFKRIKEMDRLILENISLEAKKTAMQFSDSKVAQLYLENILKDDE